MHIDDVDALREWLTNFLAPLCDADPSALARYCIALVRKDKPTAELKEDMLHQLEVFLLQNTATFVEKFLVVVDKKTYLPKKSNNDAKQISSTKPTGDSKHASDVKNDSDAKNTSDVKQTVGGDSSTGGVGKPEQKSYLPSSVAPLPSSLPPLPPKHTRDGPLSQLQSDSNGIIEAPPAKSTLGAAALSAVPEAPLSDGSVGALSSQVFKKEDSGKTRKEDRESISWRGRSRDRRRSRSRGRNIGSLRTTKHDDRPRRRYRRSWSRSRSPSPRHCRYSRTSPSRGARIRSPGRRSRSPRRSPSQKLRSRSPNHLSRSPLLKPHSPPVIRSRSRSPLGLLQARSPRSPLASRRSRSPLGGRRSRSPSKGLKGALMGLPDSPTGGQSPVLADTADPEDLTSDVAELPLTKLSSARRKKHRCKDYDEKGYCMRGDQCPYDHGADPVVLDFTPPTPYTASLPPDTAPPPSQGIMGPNIAVPPPPHLAGRLTLPPSVPASDPLNEYTPSDPILWGSTPSTGGPNTSLPPPHFYGKPMRGGMMMMGPPPPLNHSGFPPINHPPPSLPIHIPPPPFGGHPMGPRELINVSTADPGHCNKGMIRPSLAQRLGPPSTRAPPPIRGPSSRHNSSIELRKIPRGINTITHLNSHFQKFGKIVNMQVQFDGDPEAAVITFSKHSEANAAYRSTEAVLNNRFIKVFWHGGPAGKTPPHSVLGDNGQAAGRQFTKVTSSLRPPTAPADAQSGAVMTGPALGSTAETESVTALPDSSTATESSAPAKPVPHKPTAQEIKQQQIELIMQQQKQLAAEVAQKQAEEKKKAETAKLKVEVRTRMQQLLDKQMQELKLLLTKMEKSRTSSSKSEQLELLRAIKTLESGIEATKKQLKASIPAGAARTKPKSATVAPVLPSAAGGKASATTPAVPGVEDAAQVVAKGTTELAKKILDTEMDVYAVAATGAKDSISKGASGEAAPVKSSSSSAEELAQLKSKLAMLKKETLHFGLKRGRGQPMPGRGGRGSAAAGRGRAGAPAQAPAAVPAYVPSEKRSCKLHASGFEPEDKDAVLTHFASLGTVISFLWDGQTPSVTVEYSTRRHAEKAMTEGRLLGDRLLTLTWVGEQRTSARLPVPSTQQYLDVQYDPAIQHDEEDDDDDGNIFDRNPPSAASGKRARHAKENEQNRVKKTEVESKAVPASTRNVVSPTAAITTTAETSAVSRSMEEEKSEEEPDSKKQRVSSESSMILHDELLHESDDTIIVCDDEEIDEEDDDEEHDESSWKR